VQTFLPYRSFYETAEALDYRRLGKQRVETKQIINALNGNSVGWVNHPATKMWRGYDGAIAKYGLIMCKVWQERGYQDNLSDFFRQAFIDAKNKKEYPHWLGDESLHISHQSNLIRKDSDFYRPKFGLLVPDDLPYVWLDGKPND
jgi:hypothetical protein